MLRGSHTIHTCHPMFLKCYVTCVMWHVTWRRYSLSFGQHMQRKSSGKQVIFALALGLTSRVSRWRKSSFWFSWCSVVPCFCIRWWTKAQKFVFWCKCNSESCWEMECGLQQQVRFMLLIALTITIFYLSWILLDLPRYFLLTLSSLLCCSAIYSVFVGTHGGIMRLLTTE